MDANRVWFMPKRAAAILLAVSLVVAAFCALVVAGVLASPGGGARNVPIAVANLDRGTIVHGRRVNFGTRLVGTFIGNPKLRGVVAWSMVGTRAGIVGAMDDDKDYAGLVIPADYSSRLAALLNPRMSALAPARLEILTNPAAGLTANSVASGVLLTAAGAVDSVVARQVVTSLRQAHVRVGPQAAQIYGNPVQVVQTVAEPTPNNTGRGAAPFYIALTVLLTSILGTAIVSQGIDVLNREAMAKGLKIGAAQTWRIKTALATVFCIPAAAIQTWIALGVLGIPASGWGSFLLFTLLCLLTISALTLFWITLAGPRGIVLTILFAIALGVPASGGTVPVQMLPDFYVWLHSWVPLRFVIDGFRAIILFHGRGDAGVSTATWVLLFDVCLCVVLAGAIALVKDARQRRSQVRMAAREPELAGTI